MAYLFHLVTLVGIYTILSISLNLVVGDMGLVALTHAAFFGIGAYTAAITLTRFHYSIFFAFLGAIILVACVAFLLSFVLRRFRDDYYMIATLATTMIVFGFFQNMDALTNGPLGIPGIPKPSYFFLLLCGALITTHAIVWWMRRSSFGRVLHVIREDDILARVFGYETTHFFTFTFVVSAIFAAIAGVLYALYLSFIDPTMFRLQESILILSMIVVGGLSSLRGSYVGAFLLVLLPEFLRFVGLPDAIAAHMRELLYGLLLVIIMRFRPQGFFGEYKL